MADLEVQRLRDLIREVIESEHVLPTALYERLREELAGTRTTQIDNFPLSVCLCCGFEACAFTSPEQTRRCFDQLRDLLNDAERRARTAQETIAEMTSENDDNEPWRA